MSTDNGNGHKVTEKVTAVIEIGKKPRNPNLRPCWQKGHVANPKGRPRGPSFTEWATAVLDEKFDATDAKSPTRMEYLVRRVVDRAINKCDRDCIAFLLERVDPATKYKVTLNAKGSVSDVVAHLRGLGASFAPDQLIDAEMPAPPQLPSDTIPQNDNGTPSATAEQQPSNSG